MATSRQRIVSALFLAQIELKKLNPVGEAGEVFQGFVNEMRSGDGVAPVEQIFGQMRADEAGDAGD